MAHVAITARAELRLFRALEDPCGVALYDPQTGETGFRFRTQFAGPEADVLAAIAADLPEKCREMGPAAFFRWVDESLSMSFRVDDAQPVLYSNFQQTLDNQFQRKVEGLRTGVLLPLHHRRAAAGPFRGEDEDFLEGEVEAPPGIRGGFAVRIQGRSMEPEIPDGCIAVFRPYGGGSRENKIMLVEQAGEGGMASWTLKRYHSRKQVQANEFGDTEWSHEAIGMESRNLDYDDFDLDAARGYRTIGEFVAVLTD